MVKFKKSLGQNLLIDQNIINKISNLVDIENKTVLEIGPGTGNLTKKILDKKPNLLIVVEKDEVLSDKLEIACSNNKSLKIIEIQRQGKKPQKIGEFMLGSRIKKGSIITNV